MAERDQDLDSRAADVPTALLPGESTAATLAEGEIVNQKIINSSINVVTGDQIHGNKVINYNINDESRASPAGQSISSSKIIQICNDNTKEVTAIDVLEDFRHEDLQQPDFEVYPQMRRIAVNDYYKGRYDNTIYQGFQNDTVHNQLTKEVGFLRQGEIKGKMVGIDDVVGSIWQREMLSSSKAVGVTAIVASAGSGKSTLTRRIARQALRISSAREDIEHLPAYNEKMVHYIVLKDIEEVGQIKPSKFLFGGLYKNEVEEDQAFEWLDKHQSQAILVFDGLDQARWNFDVKYLRTIKKHDKASAWTVMYNILSRNILRHVKVYIASREFRVSELPAMARPETIITLNGLTLKDAQRLYAFLLGENGEELWQRIEAMSPRLLSLVTVPVFLILTAIVMGRDPSTPPPSTVTELYSRIILALQSIENIRNREQILSIIHKLKALAFQGMKEGRVVFKETELKLFGVSAEEVRDLMTKVPGNNLLSRHLMQGDFTFFFCHQSVQEYLAAIFVTEMDFNEFSCFDEQHLHKERWSVVRRFVAGIVFSKSLNGLHRVSDQTKKQEVFTRSICSQLTKHTERKDYARMEIYTAIYESDDDDVLKHLSVINACGISLSRDQAHIVASFAARNENLESLNLEDCNIDDGLLATITRCLKDRIPGRADRPMAVTDPWEVMEKRKRLLEFSINSELSLAAMEIGFELPMIKRVLRRKIRLSDNTYSTPTAFLKDLLNPPADLDPDSDYDDVDPVDNVPGDCATSQIGRQGGAAIEPRKVMEERKILLESSINSELTLRAMEMGFKLPMIKRVLQRKIRLSDNTYNNPRDLLEDLLNPPADLDPDSDYDDVDPADYDDIDPVHNVPEASEASKIGMQVKEVNLADNNVSATALCSLLGHRRIHSLSGNLYWTVCKLTADGYYLALKDEKDVIKISSLHVAGHFNIKESTLVLKEFQPCAQLDLAAYLGLLFDAKSIKHHGYICAKQDVLPKLSKWKLHKISKILLDCTEEKNIEWSLIETSFKNCQVELLDIVVNGHNTFTDDYNRILERWKRASAFGFNVNIHEIFIVRKGDNFRKMIEASQQKKMECIIYIFGNGFRASFDEILSLVNNSDSKKVTLIFYDDGSVLRGNELKEVQKIAIDLNIELELSSWYGLHDNAWMELTHDFYYK